MKLRLDHLVRIFKLAFTAVDNQTTCGTESELCCTPLGYRCGLRYPPVIGSKNVSGEQIFTPEFLKLFAISHQRLDRTSDLIHGKASSSTTTTMSRPAV